MIDQWLMAGDRPQFGIDGNTVIVAFITAAFHVLRFRKLPHLD